MLFDVLVDQPLVAISDRPFALALLFAKASRLGSALAVLRMPTDGLFA
ncbi:MAG: hypothetical protein JJ961_10060 [Roseitalea sp.]|nr:hypothetical protein [Roseitalea sp.]MBO6590996.1 hypothetical protein [Roseitalea sp.]MBO6732217.1 hypothetical protein [Roseitalea sp.]MBO6951017.1 hypothetical protein [Rhizobiaceae bacterium]